MIAPFLLMSCSNPFQETKPVSSPFIGSGTTQEAKIETNTGSTLSGSTTESQDVASTALSWINIADNSGSGYSRYILEDGKIIELIGIGEDKEVVAWADVATFQIVPGTIYARDKNNLYADREVLTNFDRQTFEVLNIHYVKDKNGIYYYNYKNVIPLVGVDTASFHVFDLFFAKDKKNVYLRSKIFEWVDPTTFTASDWFGHDKNAVYDADGKKIDIISDPASFEGLPPESWKGWQDGCSYLKDKNNVYIFGDEGAYKILEGADAGTFERISSTPYYGKDRTSVYFCANKIQWADPQTFTIDKSGEAKDKNRIYDYSGKPLDIRSSIDIASFERMWNWYAKDKNNVYCGTDTNYNIIPWADPQTFQDLEEMIPYEHSNGGMDQTKVAKDKNHYYNGACQVAP